MADMRVMTGMGKRCGGADIGDIHSGGDLKPTPKHMLVLATLVAKPAEEQKQVAAAGCRVQHSGNALLLKVDLRDAFLPEEQVFPAGTLWAQPWAKVRIQVNATVRCAPLPQK